METFVAAIALILVLEGTLYALFPTGMKRMLAEVLRIPDATIRNFGLIAAAIGVAVLWITYR